MVKKKSDNLPAEQSASQPSELELLEQAARAYVPQTAEVIEPIKEEKEAVVGEPVAGTPQEPIKEAVEDKYDYKKGYEDLRPLITRLSQDVAELRKSAPKEQPYNPYETNRYEPKQVITPEITAQQWREAYEVDPIATTRLLAQYEADQKSKSLNTQVEQLKGVLGGFLAENTVTQFRSKYNDFPKIELEIKEEINKLPQDITHNPIYYNSVLENAYWAVKGRKTAEAQRIAFEEGQKKAQQKAVEKSAAYVEGASKSAASQSLDPSKMSATELWDLMRAKGIVNQ